MSLAWVLSTWLVAAVSAAPPPVRAVTIEGAAVEGAWSGVAASGAVVLVVNGQKKEFAAEDLMLLRWAEPPTSRPATAAQPAAAYLSDGSLVQGKFVGGDARHVVLQTAQVPELTVALENLAALRIMPGEHPAAAEAFAKALAARDPAQDTLLVIRDDRVSALKGVTESLAPDRGTFRWRDRSVPITPGNVYGLVFAAGVQKPDPPQARARLKDGSTWAGRLAGGDADAVNIELVGGVKAALPVGELCEIRLRSDRVVFLSDLEPVEYAFEPFATTRWPYRRDRSAANRPLRIGDQSFERGIGMHAQSTLTYDLPGEFSRLAAVIGIDAGAAPLGNVVFRVTADGQEAFHSGPVTGRDAPRAINVPVAGAKRVQLIVEFGEDLDIGDQADWGNVRLIK